MTPEMKVALFSLVISGGGAIIFAIRTLLHRVGADTEQKQADTKKDEAVTTLAMLNYQERKDQSESMSVLREKLSYLQGQYDIAIAKIASLETQMKDLGTTYESRIQELERIIAARDETIADLKLQVKTLSETVEKLIAREVPPTAS